MLFRSEPGNRWRPELSEQMFHPYPHVVETDSYSGPLAVIGSKSVRLLGYCPACGYGTISLTRTDDGGRHWRRRRIRGPVGARAAVAGFTHGLAFPDRRHGWLVTQDRGRRGEVYGTADGGRSWRRERL